MTNAPNTERRISLWMEQEEAGTHFPDRLLSATFEQTRELRQARSLRRRTFPMLRSWTSLAAAGAAAVATVAIVGVLGVTVVVNVVGPAGSPSPGASALPSVQVAPPTKLRRDGEILVFRWGAEPGWDLAAKDPETGEVRTIVDTAGILDCTPGRCSVNFVKTAQWSPDGRWVAFEVSFGSLDGMGIHGPCGPTAGLWVQGATGQPRQLTTPCEATPGAEDINELWAWSPDGTRLAYARADGDDDRLFLIDPSDGRRTLLIEGGGAPTGPSIRGPSRSTLLAWSPDRTRLAYAVGGSVYELQVETRDRSLLADSFDDVMDIRYSPDGTKIMVRNHDFDRDRDRLQVMNGDGSDLRLVLEGPESYDEAAWSPKGDRIVYQLSINNGTGFFDSEVWTVAPDGMDRIKVFDSDGCNMGRIQDALPIWAPNGVQVAYNACGSWVVSNADGTGEAQPIDELLHRSWSGGALSGWALLGLR